LPRCWHHHVLLFAGVSCDVRVVSPPHQIDRQAEDRCHRLGQVRPVTVHRMVAKDTVDQDVAAIAERKLRLDAAVLGSVTVSTHAEGSERVGLGRGRAGRAGETRHMGEILAGLLSADD